MVFVLKVFGMVFGDEFLAQGLHLKSHQKW